VKTAKSLKIWANSLKIRAKWLSTCFDFKKWGPNNRIERGNGPGHPRQGGPKSEVTKIKIL